MAQLETWIRQDLKKPLQVQYLSGTMFSQDNAANLVGVEVFDDGEPATLGGSVSANVVRSDGGTVAVSSGTVSGNKVSVVLPHAAYAIPGQISIIIKLTTSGTVTTLGAIVVTVYRSSTDTVVDPGTIIPSVQNLISQIETAVASIPADYSSLWASLAPAFSNSTAYTAGQCVTYNGHLYRFTANHAAGSFVNTDCTQVDVGSELSALKSAIREPYPPIISTRTFEQGGLNSSNGGKSSSTKRIRTYSYFMPGIGVKITIPSNMKAMWFRYGSEEVASYEGYSGSWMADNIDLVGNKYYKIVVAYNDDSNITPSAGENVSFAFNGTNKDLTVEGAAADAKAVGDLLLPSFLYRGAFPGDTDLNDVKSAGMYNMPTGNTYANAPDLEGHVAQLFVFGSTSYIFQVCTSRYMDGKIYYRHFAVSSFSSWRCIPMQFGTYTSEDDLDDYAETGGIVYSASSVPANAPRSDIGGVVYGLEFDSVYRWQLCMNARNDYYIREKVLTGWTNWKNLSRPKDILDFTVLKGVWIRSGKRSENALAVCADHIFELIPGSVLDFYLDPGWTYTIMEGESRTRLTATAHLSRVRTHIVQFPYVAINFNKFVDGESVDLTVRDFNDSVIIHTSGDALGEKNVNDYHDFPENVGQLNVINRAYQLSKIAYTTLNTLPLHSGGSKSVTIRDVPAKTDLDGVPYSSMRETMASVPQAVSFDAFMTMINNPNSYIYTKHYEQGAPGYDYNSRCYVGAVCSTLVAYCYGIEDALPTTISFANYPGLNPLPQSQQNPQSLKIADMLNKAGDHIVIITDIIRTERGKVKSIEITEAAKPLCHSVVMTPEEIIESYLGNGFVAYRYEYVDEVPYTPSPWVHIDETEKDTPVYNTILSPKKGEKSNWAVGETVEIDVLDNTAGYTQYVLTNVDISSVVSTASIPSGNVITITGIPEGRYTMHLENGSNTSDPVLFDVIEAEARYTPLGDHMVAVEFESAANRVPSAIYWCCNNQSSSDYKAVRDFHILTAAEVSDGRAVVNEPVEYRISDTNNGVWLMRMCFKTEFGLFASPLETVSVT